MATVGLLISSPFLALAAIYIKLDSAGPIFYLQDRIGLHGKPFKIFKFRTMICNADKVGTLVTIGSNDCRITKSGFLLRKFKIDELPQFINVLLGHMSFVGPRPEVLKYVALYTVKQREILKVRPGITDIASIVYRNENEILTNRIDPEAYYMNTIMQRKIRLNQLYLAKRSVCTDVIVILKTIFKIGK